jgi:N-acetylmuramoyl-L-alanine amidase
VDLPPREELARYAAPAAFLLAVTIAALLIRSGFESGSSGSAAPTVAVTTRTTTRAETTTTASTSTTTTTAKQYYTIQSGDTYDTVAAKYGKTADDLLALNPGVDPHALRIGQKIRVG